LIVPSSRCPHVARDHRPSAPRSRFVFWLGAALSLGSVALGCTDYEPASDVLPEGTISELGPEWSCLNRTAAPSSVPTFSGTVPRVVFSIQVVDLSTGNIYPDAQVRACGLADINCDDPVTDVLSVDAEGWVDVPLFQNFTGYLEIQSPDLVPYLFYLTEPLAPTSTIEYPLAVVSLAALGPLAQLVGVDSLQASKGVIATRVFNCTGDTATGASLTTEGDGVPWYFLDGLPTGMGSETGAQGLAGYVNVSPGLAVVEARAPDGTTIAGPQSLVVRAGWLSAVYVKPPGRQRAVAQ
jgi:hypothetical protein